MKNKISNSLKKSFTYIKKHSTNFLLGTIVLLLIIGLYQKNPFLRNTGYREKIEYIGKTDLTCKKLNRTTIYDAYRKRTWWLWIFKTSDKLAFSNYNTGEYSDIHAETKSCECTYKTMLGKCKITKPQTPKASSEWDYWFQFKN